MRGILTPPPISSTIEISSKVLLAISSTLSMGLVN